MLELAPRHKMGLSLANPVLIASGCGGYGDSYQRLIDLSLFGALVTNPITLRPQRGAAQPRLAETTAGFILDTGAQNPGVRKVIQQHRKSWFRLGLPIITHLPLAEPDDLRRTARALAGVETPQGHAAIAAFELGLPPQADPFDIEHGLQAIQAGCELPILVKLPLGSGPEMAAAAAQAQADALVVGAPPLGRARLTTGEMVAGHLYGPALHSLALHDLRLIGEMVNLPLIAVGGIHTLADAQAFLEAGAVAVQIDALLFIDPRAAYQIAAALQPGPSLE